MNIARSLWLVSILTVGTGAFADTLRVAVAANFKPTLEQLIPEFEAGSNIDVEISSGSTGALYAQIVNGAPFDVFLAADAARPLRLEKENRILTGSRKTYAVGRLVFWTPSQEPVTKNDLQRWDAPLAVANPRLAPYGRAGMETLDHLGVSPALIQGGNIAQTYTFVATGNVTGGLVALSQVTLRNVPEGSYWLIPENYHSPIEQQLVVLRNAAQSATRFVAYLGGAHARALMIAAGYDVPPEARVGR